MFVSTSSRTPVAANRSRLPGPGRRVRLPRANWPFCAPSCRICSAWRRCTPTRRGNHLDRAGSDRRARWGAGPLAPARCYRPGRSRERRRGPSAPRSRRAERRPRRTACCDTRPFRAAPGSSRPRSRLEPFTRGLRRAAPAPPIRQAGPRPRGYPSPIPLVGPGHRARVHRSPHHGPARPSDAGSGHPRRRIRSHAVGGQCWPPICCPDRALSRRR